jgi:signal transduction histidine kinase
MPVTISPKPKLGVPLRPLRRSSTDGILGGICAGIAVRMGVRERTIRIVFSISAFVFGLGLLLYMALWLFMARSGEHQSIGQRISHQRRETEILLLAVIVVLGIALSVHSIAFHHGGPLRHGWFFQGNSSFVWAILLSAVAILAIWRGTSSEERVHLQGLVNAAPVVGKASSRGWKAVALRVIPGVILVVVGLRIMNRIGGVWGAAVPALIGAMVLLFGVFVLLAPWWLQMVRDLSSERRERVRIEERASMVAHIHDSVLQTLTLIERAAGSEVDVVRLARAQERELRQWLFDPNFDRDSKKAPESFAALLATIERDVENDYGVKVELVVVGDCSADENVRALVAAGREAAINAAKWSGASIISIFGEVEPAALSLFVRDTGSGFDLASVASDRQGIALSIRQRMSQHGGEATINTTIGTGTEVQLRLARSVARP